MTKIYENAIASITLGISDYQSNEEARHISAVRNFYSGVLLLGKQCLLNETPKADPMKVLASQFVPIPNGDGGVDYKPKGQRTVDLLGLRARFGEFDIRWPPGNINSLQKIRNEFEHYHSPAPKEAIRQALADCFPIVQGFFETLGENPAEALGCAWEVMLKEEKFFAQQKAECDQSFATMHWHVDLLNTNQIQCSVCGSSLICQTDPQNDDPGSIDGRCRACGATHSAEQTVQIIVSGEFGADNYIAAMEGRGGTIHDCPECGLNTYVTHDVFNTCFFCEYTVEGDCVRCGEKLSILNKSVSTSILCDYCDHMSSKDD